MRAIVVHNFYRSANASGENLSVLDEVGGLREMGWDVELISADSDVIGGKDLPLASVALRPIRSQQSLDRVQESIDRFRPDVALVENLFPLHSPSVIRALKRSGVPVAAGVRNYRMFCAASTTYRDGHRCTECVGTRLNAPAIRHGCYQQSAVRSVPMALSLALHRPTFRMIDAFLAVSRYVRGQLVEYGVPEGRIVVRPNFIEDPGPNDDDGGDGFLFAGRLTPDKGVELMVDAWRQSGLWRSERLRIAGTGELGELLDHQPAHLKIDRLGLVPHDQMLQYVRNAAVTVVPSLWPEPFGRGVIEAASHARPALVTDSGGLPELVEDGVSGWVAAPTVRALAEGFRRAADPAARVIAGRAARARFERQSTKAISLGVLDATLSSLATRRNPPNVNESSSSRSAGPKHTS